MSTGAENEETEKLAPKPTTEEESDDVPVAVIETEIKENVASIPKHLRGVSTLSADDKSVFEKEDDNLISQNQLNLARLGGRASSENVYHSQRSASGSSGTFGWFVDVQGVEAGEESPKVKEQDKKQSVKFKDDIGVHLFSDADELTQFVDISQQNVDTETPSDALNAPNYILEQNLSDQMLWKHTAGNRPPQPEEEREYFEMLWRQNFALSNVEYNVPKESLIEGTSSSPYYGGNDAIAPNFSSYNLATDFMATDAEVAEAIHRLHGGVNMTSVEKTKPQIVNKKVKGGSNEDLTVLIQGDNVFGTTVSKSFDRVHANGNREVDTVNISVASYRVVESKKYGKYAQFLVIYREGGIRDTIGVWKRYSDFEALSRKVVESHDGCSSVLANMSPLAVTEDGDVEHLPNAITSWRLLKKRQRWFRCLDAGYLSLKVFLLERFLHDILFESTSPNLLRDFVIYDKSGGGSG
jgi:hypothetical protein